MSGKHFLWRLWLRVHVLLAGLALTSGGPMPTRTSITPLDVDMALMVMHDISMRNFGTLCATHFFQTIYVPVQTLIYDETRQKTDMAATIIQDVGLNHHGMVDATCKSLILSDKRVTAARILTINSTTGTVITATTWKRPPGPSSFLEINGPIKATDENPLPGLRPNRAFPWYEDASGSPVWSPKFMSSPPNMSFKGWWTFPYYSCLSHKWLISYSIPIPFAGHATKGFLSVDVDISNLEVNQCDAGKKSSVHEISVFRGTHKCPKNTVCRNKAEPGLLRGGYDCVCKPGYYSPTGPYNGTLVEATYEEKMLNESSSYDRAFVCLKCAPGCRECKDRSPCLATYHWTFRTILLGISMACAVLTLILMVFVYYNRKLKVFKLASPIFLSITLAGCCIMYVEMASIYPVLNMYSCIATKWIRHMGFCVTYSALLMKTWRVSLTYRVKSAHRIKLTERELLQWMVPILLVMTIYLGAWTFSDPPVGEVIKDQTGLEFKQCSFNWWDYILAIAEIIFLIWGVRICYNVRHAESYYNEARMISYAIYNIAAVNIVMIAFHILLLPHAGPDVKYLLGFVRTQLSTTVTIGLVFWPKIRRIWQGKGDEWDASESTAGVSPTGSTDGLDVTTSLIEKLKRDIEQLRECLHRLLCNLHYWRIRQMIAGNPHLRPRSEGPFNLDTLIAATTALLDNDDFEPIIRLLNTPGLLNAIEEGESAEQIELQNMQVQTESQGSPVPSAPAISRRHSI